MFKFEVGKLYRIGGDMDDHVGKVIRITDRMARLFGNLYFFETVRGKPMTVNTFVEGSVMSKGLIPVREMIVIYRKDNKVVALDKATGKEGVARCAPEDTFDFETGAKLAFKRLVGEDTAAEPVKPEEPKFKVGEFVRVVSAKSGNIAEMHAFPIGQIVKVVRVMDDSYDCEGVVKSRFGYVVSTQIVNPEHIEKLEEA
jgi:hypothetical protein